MTLGAVETVGIRVLESFAKSIEKFCSTAAMQMIIAFKVCSTAAMQMIITRAATAVKNEAKTNAAGVAAVIKSHFYIKSIRLIFLTVLTKY